MISNVYGDVNYIESFVTNMDAFFKRIFRIIFIKSISLVLQYK